MRRTTGLFRKWLLVPGILLLAWLSIGSDAGPADHSVQAVAAGPDAVGEVSTSKAYEGPRYQGRFRYTRYGWQDLNDWVPPATNDVPTGLELIHPVWLAVGIFLLGMGAMIWSAEEWDATRFIEGPAAVCRRRRPRSPCVSDYL